MSAADLAEMSDAELDAQIAARDLRRAAAAAEKLKLETETRLETEAEILVEKYTAQMKKVPKSKAGASPKPADFDKKLMSQTIREMCMKIATLEDALKSAPPPAAAGSKSKKKSALRGAKIEFSNKVKCHADGECCAVLNKFQGQKSTFRKCDEDATASGLCGSCHKNNLRDGFNRYGVVVEGEVFEISAEIFGSDDEIGACAKSHQSYVSRLKNNIENP